MKYINIWDYYDKRYPFQAFIGGRGTGKSYSALQGCLLKDKKFIYMRRTAQELDLMLDSDKGEGANPFKPLNKDLGRDIGLSRIVKNLAGIYNRETVDDKIQPVGAPIGYGVALSTIASIRSLDFSDCDICIYDEFIPEKHIRRIKNEGTALLNAYETMNRNRELKGEPPLQVLGLANAFNIANPVFLELGLVGRCEKMKNNDQEFFMDPERGILLVLLQHSRISKAKADTALYRLSSGSYKDMALSNDFIYNNSDSIKAQGLKEYKLLCTVGEISIYRHKSKREYYVSEHRTGTAPLYKSDEVGIMRYRRKFGLILAPAYVNNRVIFENILTKSLFELYTI